MMGPLFPLPSRIRTGRGFSSRPSLVGRLSFRGIPSNHLVFTGLCRETKSHGAKNLDTVLIRENDRKSYFSKVLATSAGGYLEEGSTSWKRPVLSVTSFDSCPTRTTLSKRLASRERSASRGFGTFRASPQSERRGCTHCGETVDPSKTGIGIACKQNTPCKWLWFHVLPT